jgi:hypothetical protein
VICWFGRWFDILGWMLCRERASSRICLQNSGLTQRIWQLSGAVNPEKQPRYTCAAWCVLQRVELG